LLADRQLWLIMAMFSCYVWGSMFYLTWFPTYLVQGRGFSEKEMGLFSALPFAMGALGNFLGGYLSDHLGQRFGLARARRYVGTLSLSLSALLLILTGLTPGKSAAIVFLSVGFGIMDCMLPVAWALCLDLGGIHAGAVAGAMNSAGQAGGFICTLLFGYLVKAYGNYDLPLFAIAGMVFVSAVLFWRIDISKSRMQVRRLDAPLSRCV
jgi:predicted MFS family arabinose efflux permease